MVDITDNFEYIGLYLSKETKEALKNYLFKCPLTSNLIEGSEIHLHHCTLLHRSCKEEFLRRAIIENFKYNQGKRYVIQLTHIGISDKVIAFRVSLDFTGLICQNKDPHITICTMKDGKPVDSNEIKFWFSIAPIKIEVYLDYTAKI